MNVRRTAALGAIALVMLSGCAPRLPKGVDPDDLTDAISAGIGDPATCVLIAPAGSSRVAYRYNTHTTCARLLPTCEGEGRRTLEDLLALVAKDGRTRMVSCPSTPDGARTVAWAAGPVPGRRLNYAAVMEGERALPSRMVAERLARAFTDAGL